MPFDILYENIPFDKPVVIGLMVVVFFVLFMLLQFIWLCSLAATGKRRRAESEQNRYLINQRLSSIFFPSNSRFVAGELSQLKKLLGKNKENYDILTEFFFEKLDSISPDDEYSQHTLYEIINIVNPVDFYRHLLKSGSKREKAHACRVLADYSSSEGAYLIEKHMASKDADLSFNAAVALSKLGQEDYVSKFVVDSKNNYNYSHRMMYKLMGEYNNDVKALASLIFRECDDYVKATVIKFIAQYNFKEFEDIYLQSVKSKNALLRVAAVTALGSFKDETHEKYIIQATNDKMWIVRNAAVKALGNYNSENAVKAVMKATGDNEWWVRYNAANTLTTMENGIEHIEEILSSQDKYASDAVKYVLYKTYT